ncbi:MAG TPA: alpha/beta fold hydrolase [Anaerolineales bacterium]|nr:alpha/beta fold hydrolase [Anaerolineales bacterium]
MKQRACLFVFTALLAACQPAAPLLSPPTLPPPQVFVETMTPSPVPTMTFTPSPTPTVEELIFPYTIEGLRQHDYKSGKIHIQEELDDENQFYTSYLIDYPSDGLTITGVMQIPVGEGPFPVIVMNHGFFARSIYNTGDGTDRVSPYLAEHGYITIAPDYRSWGASDAGESFFYSGLVIDVINLIKAIPSIPQADPKRIGIWGHSMGGGVTMKVLTVLGGRDARVKAAVLYSPVSADDADMIERWGMGCFGDIAAGELVEGCNSSDIIPETLPRNLQDAYRFAATDADTLKKISSIHHLNYVDVPIQIHYGTEDGKLLSGTPPQWSVKLTQALRDAGKDAALFQYEGEGHSFIGQPWFDFMSRTLRFFDEYVKDTSR